SDGGLDSETGLRSMTVFERDLKREIERLARSKNPFCLAAVTIDYMGEETEETLMSEVVQKAAEGVLECLRTFDDAYRKGPYQFILSLKNTDYPGANAAINRINRYFKNENMVFDDQGTKRVVSISCAISEVLPTDNPNELVDNLMADCLKNAEEPGTVLQFQELSQLQRFVKKIGD
ncbi:MAG: diguanylate cyclase, partial [Pseudomonadota bacterium]